MRKRSSLPNKGGRSRTRTLSKPDPERVRSSTEFGPLRFISEEIEVHFDEPPALLKRPHAPDRFTWQGREHVVDRLLSAWTDYERRGDMAKNMSPEHLRTARQRGSWGVGRFYFRLETEQARVFDLYYDRAPERAADRAGHWYLWRELEKRDAD